MHLVLLRTTGQALVRDRQEDTLRWAELDGRGGGCPWEPGLSEGQRILEKGPWGLRSCGSGAGGTFPWRVLQRTY